MTTSKAKELHALTPCIFLPVSNREVEQMFIEHGYGITFIQDEADIIVFTGGADINPLLYGQRRNSKTSINHNRDLIDISCFKQASQHQRLVGICRGAQLLNVLVGNGTLYQHVDGHTKSHVAYELDKNDKDGKSGGFNVTSTHHQMMIQGEAGIPILGARAASQFYTQEEKPDHIVKLTDRFEPNYNFDLEAVYYSDGYDTLCYQPHPEYAGINSPIRKHFFETMRDYMLTQDEFTAVKHNLKKDT